MEDNSLLGGGGCWDKGGLCATLCSSHLGTTHQAQMRLNPITQTTGTMTIKFTENKKRKPFSCSVTSDRRRCLKITNKDSWTTLNKKLEHVHEKSVWFFLTYISEYALEIWHRSSSPPLSVWIFVHVYFWKANRTMRWQWQSLVLHWCNTLEFLVQDFRTSYSRANNNYHYLPMWSLMSRLSNASCSLKVENPKNPRGDREFWVLQMRAN